VALSVVTRALGCVAALALAGWPGAGRAADAALPLTLDCAAAPGVRVQGPALQPAEADLVCAGGARAFGLLQDLGLALPARTTVTLVARMPGELRGRALGCYEPDDGSVLLLDRAAFDATGGWFGQPPDDELYRSAATHELAHAVIGCQPRPRPLPVPAHEYAAYVAMFATMQPALRARILARDPGHGFDQALQINSLVYAVDPLHFAVEAWRHYQRRTDRAAWLRAVIAGEVVVDLPTDGP
jgi:hypothetical protein